MNNSPKWKDISHHDRYLLLSNNRNKYCDRNIPYPLNKEKDIFLDGEYIYDIPSFYLSIGEAINGKNGYFGACLSSLSDCLCGGFGVEDIINVSIYNAKNIEEKLNHSAWVRFALECRLNVFEGECHPDYDHLVDMEICAPIELGEKTYLTHLYEIFGGRLKIYD